MMPSALTRCLRLPVGDRSLLIQSVVLLAGARLALWALPFNAARRLLTSRAVQRPSAAPVSAERIGWAVSVANRLLPMGTCLTQALAAEALLLRSGHPVEFRIGVVKTSQDRLEAHAWVASGGCVVVGDLGQGLSVYSPLPPLPRGDS